MFKHLALLALTASAALGGAPKGFVQTDGSRFTLDGKSFYWAGTNAYWFQFISNITDVSVSMDKAKAAGLKVIRTWAFRDLNVTYVDGGLPKYGGEGAGASTIYFQSWENGKPTINYGDNGLKRMDQLVQLAEKKGLKLVMTLTNNWADYGGMDVYTVNLGGRYHDDFYTNPKIKSYYKAYVKAVVSRYSHSPAIFSWQLGNEPRCGADGNRNLPRSANCTTATVTAWADEMSRYIKTLDPYHLVSIGDEGFYNTTPGGAEWPYSGNDGVDFDTNLKLKAVDYGTFHAYPEWWSQTVEWTTQWVLDHGASQKKIGKPVVFEEYGWLSPEARLIDFGTVSNYTRIDAEGAWQKASIQSKLGGDMFWQLGVRTLSFGNSTDDGNTIFLEDPEAKVLVYAHAAEVEKLNHQYP